MADGKKQGGVIALNMDRLGAVAELDQVIRCIDGFSLFKRVFINGIGVAPDNLEAIWHDLRTFRLVILGEMKVDSPDYKRRIDRYINAPVDKSEMPDFHRFYVDDAEKAKRIELASQDNVYARFVYFGTMNDGSKIDLVKSNIRPWVVEVCRVIFRQMDLCVRGGIESEETGRVVKAKFCFNDYSCDQIFLINNQKSRGSEQRFCTKKCQKKYHARMAMRKKKRGETQQVAV
ncbi:MAG TPA: hypothetical protein EYN67_14220 [Flavobacteriales bacterium]|nr:hypothetical protein [Flavobacteriales bacterium]